MSASPEQKLETFLINVKNAMAEHPQWRGGQACFNVLMDWDSEYAEAIRGTDKDPFYITSEDQLDAFLDALKEHWSS